MQNFVRGCDYIITAKLGNNIINCYDGKYSKDELKTWTNKGLILCPVCNKPYEYCHGEFKIPYFRHKEKDKCESIYSEPETEEHICGKTSLYEWVRQQDGVTDVMLEGWIPETHQRPDIMFKYQGKQFVIEYQCTPIASEYVKRHHLYEAAGISDIWILGCDNYDTYNNTKNRIIENCAMAYYSVKNNEFNFLQFYCKHGGWNGRETMVTKNDLVRCFSDVNIGILIRRYIASKDEIDEYLKEKEKIKYIRSNYYKANEYLNDSKLGTFYYFNKKSRYDEYISKIYCKFKDETIKNLNICIYTDKFVIGYYGQYDRYGYNWNILELEEYDVFNIVDFVNRVLNIVKKHVDNYNKN